MTGECRTPLLDLDLGNERYHPLIVPQHLASSPTDYRFLFQQRFDDSRPLPSRHCIITKRHFSPWPRTNLMPPFATFFSLFPFISMGSSALRHFSGAWFLSVCAKMSGEKTKVGCSSRRGARETNRLRDGNDNGAKTLQRRTGRYGDIAGNLGRRQME